MPPSAPARRKRLFCRIDSHFGQALVVFYFAPTKGKRFQRVKDVISLRNRFVKQHPVSPSFVSIRPSATHCLDQLNPCRQGVAAQLSERELCAQQPALRIDLLEMG